MILSRRVNNLIACSQDQYDNSYVAFPMPQRGEADLCFLIQVGSCRLMTSGKICRERGEEELRLPCKRRRMISSHSNECDGGEMVNILSKKRATWSWMRCWSGGEVRKGMSTSRMMTTYIVQFPSPSSHQRSHNPIVCCMSVWSHPMLPQNHPMHHQSHDEQTVKATRLGVVQQGCLSCGTPDAVHCNRGVNDKCCWAYLRHWKHAEHDGQAHPYPE